MDNYSIIEKSNKKIVITVKVEGKKLDKETTDQTIKAISKVTKKYSSKKDIEIITDLDLNSLYKDDNLRWCLVSSLNIAKIKDKKERLHYAYDAACRYLDNEFINNNLCEFENDICLEKRKNKTTNGCCHQFKHKYFGPLLDGTPNVLCKYQKDKHCTADCLGCKLFVCDIIREKKGVYFDTKNVPLIRYYFNRIQKIIIRQIVFTHKDKILKMLEFFSL